MQEGALNHLRVVDLTDERGIYGAKLLADLGADVIRPEPPGGDPLRERGPHIEGRSDANSSLYYAYFATNRKSFVVDAANEASIRQLERLLQLADVVLYSETGLLGGQIDIEQICEQSDKQILVNITSFGKEGPWADYLAPDLVAGALAGAVATTGDATTPPLKTYGELNFMVSGVYAAIAALSGIFARDNHGVTQQVDMSVHECIASCLEQVFMFYWYAEGALERPGEQVLPRRGPTHWSNAFTVMNGKDGSIMITPTPDFDRQLAWLIEEDAHGDLMEPQYQDPENLPLLIGRTMQLLAEWVATREVEELFLDAQSRHIPYGWVQPLARIGENPQLQAREWFVNQRVGDDNLTLPGAPYHLSATPWHMGDGAELGEHTQQILSDIGWEASS